MIRLLIILGFSTAACAISQLPQTITGDASRGEQLLHDRGCILCHKVDGQGGDAAPDLGTRVSRDYTPAHLAGIIWNHVVPKPADSRVSGLSENETADLFAYFASRRYFERAGDAGRGKQVFVEKHCNTCHGVSGRRSPGASPVIEWRSLRDPIAFAQEMWNRSPAMAFAFARHGMHYPRLTSPELNDLLVYLENLPVARGRESRFQLPSSESGRVLFQAKGCADCHRAKLSLEDRGWRSMADISASMWSHSISKGESRPYLSYSDMSELVSYLWSLQDQGDSRRGRRIFVRKRCASCHEQSRTGGEVARISLFSRSEAIPVPMITALGNYGPSMRADMTRKGVAWPHFANSEMADLVGYLETAVSPVPEEVTHRAAGLGRLAHVF